MCVSFFKRSSETVVSNNGAASAACVDCFYIGFNLTRTRRKTALPN
ncbi:hypothetical protein MCC93_08800 [Morococcus cerebrosus]|uniref:Uncharacterized protein n=1 Tax=Morococcus cerebrosus TaxID=1056807 RepID=A0A0C1GVU1_9NEIS|nr:hypothetical protein MCC93_08800 [Morococcus cerebrosus]